MTLDELEKLASAYGGEGSRMFERRDILAIIASHRALAAVHEKMRGVLTEIAAIYDTRQPIGERSESSTHIRHNLEGAIYDIERTNKADKVSMGTLNRIVNQLAEIEAALSRLEAPEQSK